MTDNKHKKVLGQARILSNDQQSAVLAFLEKHSKHPVRDSCMFLLTVKAGLRAIEVSLIEWGMVLDSDGNIAEDITLPPHVTKGGRSERTKTGKARKIPPPRVIPMHKLLKNYLIQHRKDMYPDNGFTNRIFYTERGYKYDRGKMATFFWKLYRRIGFHKCSSHSGRRTFVTTAARNAHRANTSLKDIQEMVGHVDLSTTQLYIESNPKGKRKLIDLM